MCGLGIMDKITKPHVVSLAVLLVVLLGHSCSCSGVFDPTIEVCCQGNISQRDFGPASECCGSEVYDAAHSTCCIDDDTGTANVVPIPINPRRNHGRKPEYKCCGKGLYDPQEQTCCNGTPARKTSKNSGCCNHKSYDADQFVCCDETLNRRSFTSKSKGSALPQKVLSCCGNQTYDPDKYMCCNGKMHRNWGITAACCGQEAYDFAQQGCCGGSVYEDPFGLLSCCGSTTYDLMAEICCDDVVSTDLLRHKTCCGKQSYNVYESMCCDGTVVPKTSNASKASTIAQCCGRDQFDPKKSVCCNGTAVPLPPGGVAHDLSCCGNDSYNHLEEHCCGGKVYPRRATDSGFQDTEDVCCGDTLLKANDVTKQCCRGKVVEIPKDMELCC